MKLLFALAVIATAALAADGKQEEQRSCIACHSLRLVHSQRLSRAAWNKELDKMVNWGTKIQDREALLEYLVANYGDDKPLPVPDRSGDASKR